MKKQIKIVRIVIFLFGLTFFAAGAGIGYTVYSSQGLDKGFTDDLIVPVVFMGVGLFDMLMVTIWGMVLKKREAKEKWLYENGQLIKTTFVSVDRNLRLTVNGKNPFTIQTKWQDPLTNTIHIFKSKNLWNDPSAYIDHARSITVYCDPANMKSYAFDLSFLPSEIA